MSEWNAPPPAGSQFKAPQHGLDALIHRLEQIELSVRNLASPPLLTTLLKTVSDLTAQQAALAAKDVQILDLIGKQVAPVYLNNSANGFSPSPTQFKVETAIVTPAGFTKALITAQASYRIYNNSGGTVGMDVVAIIAGVLGPTVVKSSALGDTTYDAVSHTYLLQGLTTGSVTTIGARVYAFPACTADSTNNAIISGTAIWFR